jgi:hypothetical protein
MRQLVFGEENALLYEKLEPLFQLLSCEANPIPQNTGLMQLGVIILSFGCRIIHCLWRKGRGLLRSLWLSDGKIL